MPHISNIRIYRSIQNPLTGRCAILLDRYFNQHPKIVICLCTLTARQCGLLGSVDMVEHIWTGVTLLYVTHGRICPRSTARTFRGNKVINYMWWNDPICWCKGTHIWDIGRTRMKYILVFVSNMLLILLIIYLQVLLQVIHHNDVLPDLGLRTWII